MSRIFIIVGWVTLLAGAYVKDGRVISIGMFIVLNEKLDKLWEDKS